MGQMNWRACVFLVSFFIIFFNFFVFVTNSFLLVKRDSETMLALSKTLPELFYGKSWNTNDKNPCLWNGVKCSSSTSGHVTSLSLSGLGLATSATNTSSAFAFFELLCQLESLESLDLSLNFFAFIPSSSFFSSCTGLSHLKSLNFSSNRLTGSVDDFLSFRNLEILDLSHNMLRGEVGSKFVGLSKLKSLNLSANIIGGTIPLNRGLEELVLSINCFQGKIPSEISRLKNLTFLDLSMNDLSGSVPGEIGGLSKLQLLVLSSNNLIGQIPSNLSSIQSLRYFAADRNGFTGVIPDGISRHLIYLDLSYNKLSGKIPSDLLSAPNLESVDLSSNRLEGPIPGNFSQRLFRLRLGENNLTGRVPTLFQQLPGLTYLELNNNQLSGEIPSQLGICQNLSLLNLASNRLQGGLPKELGNLSELVIVKLQENNLSGEIPNEFSKLRNLITLNLSRNFLDGPIPPSIITNLSKLLNLNLAVNRLYGPIPRNIKNLNSLIELQLGNNKLSGTVPEMPISLTSALNLSSNKLSGSIPAYLDALYQLDVLDLSNNNFTGEVPSSFTKMLSLTLLVISNNRLSGTLPKFPNRVNVIYTGNNGLTKQEPEPGTFTKKKNNTLIIIVSIVSAIIGVGLVAAVLFLVVSKQFYRVEDEGLQLEENPPQIINGCYITPDSIHRSNIDFGKAMEVVGNPSNIMLKTRFSTYYKAVMPSGMTYTVKKLNWSEKIFQMGSNQRFGQELQVLGRLSNSNVMVPLAYFLTQDNAYLFYEDVHKGTVYDSLHKGSENGLDWQSRYSIALGVAQGLTFLHGCTQPVLLLDLTTKTIHLKSMKEPQIGDIELCKVIDPSKSTGSLSTVAGSVGYIPPGETILKFHGCLFFFLNCVIYFILACLT